MVGITVRHSWHKIFLVFVILVTTRRELVSLGAQIFIKFSVFLDPIVQSIVSLTSSLRGNLVKCFMTLFPNTLIFFVKTLREA